MSKAPTGTVRSQRLNLKFDKLFSNIACTVNLRRYSVWRRVRVSGGVSLRTLHDRVIGPAMVGQCWLRVG